jgi:hypothetical protein
MSSNLLPFSMDLILENKGAGEDKYGEYGWGDLTLESPALPKIGSLTMQCDVLHSHARGISFLFPETEVLLDKLFEPNKTIFPHNIPYSPSELVKQILYMYMVPRL